MKFFRRTTPGMMAILCGVIPLRLDLPPTVTKEATIPVTGGIPFPRGALKLATEAKLLGPDGKEIPCQMRRTASWPDGSIKWLLVDTVLPARPGQELKMEYGKGIKRTRPTDPLRATAKAGTVSITGGGVQAHFRPGGKGVLAKLILKGKKIIGANKPARLVVQAIRTERDDAFPPNTFCCRDPEASRETGQVDIDKITIESPGPIRATVCLSGHIRFSKLGRTLPPPLRRADPPGRLPFTLRFSFFAGTAIVTGRHQLVYTGEPDRDFICRWSLTLPGMGGSKSRLILEPGVEPGGKTLAARLCTAPLKSGFALIREGWENRPCAITNQGDTCWLDFWPSAAGAWDLRRYCRDWAVGESGDVTDPKAMQRYARVAAYGMAKSHDFVVKFDPSQSADKAALAQPALLVALPGWYGNSGALGGVFPPEQTRGPWASLDTNTRRELDYHLFCQDLFRWHGKLNYGHWQSRFGQVHRHDRWENDYGRWGWALNDGAGRIGHTLMLQYLRTLERRYFTAGRAFNRAVYDTNMVHTTLHYRGAREWCPARGSCHRHNVQPFGCPYIGMRGANPGGHRILYFLTGDGVIADGLEMVAESAHKYAKGRGGWLGQSGGSDGQGSATLALLWKYETTGNPEFLKACRSILNKSGLFPPAPGKSLGYAPSFGLFCAAREYADLANDREFSARLGATGKALGQSKPKPARLSALTAALTTGNDQGLRSTIKNLLKTTNSGRRPSLADLDPHRWPGHAGWRTPGLDPNFCRDYPFALGLLLPPGPAEWPQLRESVKSLPAAPPPDWYSPATHQASPDLTPTADTLLQAEAQSTPPPTAGTGRFIPFIDLVKTGNGPASVLSGWRRFQGKPIALSGPGVIRTRVGPVAMTIRIERHSTANPPFHRLIAAIKVPSRTGRVAGWGLMVPRKLSADQHRIMTTAPGRFRLERTALDPNDERIPGWLTSETRFGKDHPGWPRWPHGGIQIGPGPSYRIWKATGPDVAPVFVDQGKGRAAWFDLTDRGASPAWGLTLRLLHPAKPRRQAIRVDLETGILQVQFHDPQAAPLDQASGSQGLIGGVDLLHHDGWRPPLSQPELTGEQYDRFLKDLNYGGNYGLMALRFRLSPTHQVKGLKWAEKVRDRGIEPREILYSMQWREGLAKHCKKLGLEWEPNDPEKMVRRIIAVYRKY